VKIPDRHRKAFFLESFLKHCKTFFLAGTPFTATTLRAPPSGAAPFVCGKNKGLDTSIDF
jgi:hypothetical protein